MTNPVRRGFSLRRPVLIPGIVAAAFGLALLGWTEVAQTATPSGSPPPTYDYDAITAGTQGPTSPLLAGYETHVFRAYQVQMSVLVPLPELQAMLPSGYTANATPPGSNTAQVGLQFVIQERIELSGSGTFRGTFGPASRLLVNTLATKTSLPGPELLILASFDSNPNFVDIYNDVFGPGTSRLASIKTVVKEEDGVVRFKFSVRDSSLGLNLDASAEGPSDMNTRSVIDPLPFAVRFMNNGLSVNRAFRIAIQADGQPNIPSAGAKVSGNKLQLPGGTLAINSLAPTLNFFRSAENFSKYVP